MTPNAYFALMTIANCAAAVVLWLAIYSIRRFSLASMKLPAIEHGAVRRPRSTTWVPGCLINKGVRNESN
jgi:hypothetical protein